MKQLDQTFAPMRRDGVRLWLYLVQLHELALPPDASRKRNVEAFQRLWTQRNVGRN